MARRKTPKYIEIEGLHCPWTYAPNQLRAAMNYEPTEEDVILSTYPKCGTTWMSHMATMIIHKKCSPLTEEEFIEARIPFEQTGLGKKGVVNGIRLIKTHLPVNYLKFSRKAKYIYVIRHPRDCLVSFYHYTKLFSYMGNLDGNFDDFFEAFIGNDLPYGDYFDHLFSWWKHLDKPNVFFTTFESMKANHVGTIEKLAKFLGSEFSSALHANGNELLNCIVKCTSFDFMKQQMNAVLKELGATNYVRNAGILIPLRGQKHLDYLEEVTKQIENGYLPSGDFVREGKVGQSRSIMSKKQEKRLEDWIKARTKGTGIESIWNKV